jgi:DeoR family fructose operon transcriptional repressor
MNTKRRETIKELLKSKGEVSLRELEKIFPDCSGMTLRRDLKYMEEEGMVKRTRGGAVAMNRLSSAVEDIYSFRAMENVDEKEIIARKALKFLETGRSIYLDSGTTVMLFAKFMPDEYYSIITSGPNIAMEVIKKLKPNVTLIGGQMNRNTISVSGMDAAEFIKRVNVDIAFMASSGFSLENGFTSGAYPECELKREIIKRARKRIMLMDSSKINKSMPFTFAVLRDVDVLVSDGKLSEEVLDEAKAIGIEVL